MNIVYNGVDITGDVEPIVARTTDYAGGKPDSLSLVFADLDGTWGKWGPKKGDTIRIRENGYDSGEMYIDQLTQGTGRFGIDALSIPAASRTARSQGWENVRLLEIAAEIAARYRFRLQSVGIVNHLYDRVDQTDEADFAFLARRCSMEGFALKIHDRSLVLYDERSQEQAEIDPQAAVIRAGDMLGSYEFMDKSTDIYERCIVQYASSKGMIVGECADSEVSGAVLRQTMYAADEAEASRWAKGLLRAGNKHRITGTSTIPLNTEYAAGTVIRVQDAGQFDGRYFIDAIVHDWKARRSQLRLRRPLEGY